MAESDYMSVPGLEDFQGVDVDLNVACLGLLLGQQMQFLHRVVFPDLDNDEYTVIFPDPVIERTVGAVDIDILDPAQYIMEFFGFGPYTFFIRALKPDQYEPGKWWKAQLFSRIQFLFVELGIIL